MKKLMIATAAGVVAAGAFAEAEVWNLTFNAKCLVPSYTKAGEVDYYKQGSVKYTAMQVNADTYAWDSKNYYGDATFNVTTDTFGKKDEKVAASAIFTLDGIDFLCAGFGTEKSISGSFVCDNAVAYGTWSIKVNASAAKKLNENPDLTLPDLVKLPKAVLESKKEWDALEDAVENAVRGATTLAELAEIANSKLAVAEVAYVDSTNKLEGVKAEVAGLEKDLVAYKDEFAKMEALIADKATDYTLDTADVDSKLTALEDQKKVAEQYYNDNIKPLEDQVKWLNTHEGLQSFGGDKYARDEKVKELNKEIEELQKHYKGYQDGVASYEAEWKAAVAVTNNFYAYMTDLAGFAVDAEDKTKTAAKQFAAAKKAFNAECAAREAAIKEYSKVNTEKKLSGIDERKFFVSFGALKAAEVAVDGYYNKNVYEYDVEFFNENGYWQNYSEEGSKAELANAKNFVEAVKTAQDTLSKTTADKAQIEKMLVDQLKANWL